MPQIAFNLFQIRPVRSSADVRDAGHRHAVLSSNLAEQSFIFAYFSHLSFGQFMQRMFLTALMGSVTLFVGVISLAGIIPKILKSVIRTNAVIVTNLKAIWFSKKCKGDYAWNFGRLMDAMFSQRDLVIAFGYVGFQYSSCSPTTDQRSDPTQVTDHVKSFVAGYLFPNFNIHSKMIHRLSYAAN